MLIRRDSHIVAEAMGEVCGINARIYPATNSIGDTEGDRAGVVYSTDEEGIVTGFGTGGGSSVARRLNSIVRVEMEYVSGGIVGSIFGDKGGGNMV